ncbi:hypothetical protein GW17_00061476, partial [Ensete ventricosum]
VAHHYHQFEEQLWCWSPGSEVVAACNPWKRQKVAFKASLWVCHGQMVTLDSTFGPKTKLHPRSTLNSFQLLHHQLF